MILMSQVLSDNLIKNLDEGLMKSWLQSVLPSVLGFFWSVVLALLIAYIGGKIINLVRRMFQKSLHRRDAEEGVCQFADQVLKYFLWIVIIVIILGLFGFTASSLAAAVASLGVTAGLALHIRMRERSLRSVYFIQNCAQLIIRSLLFQTVHLPIRV